VGLYVGRRGSGQSVPHQRLLNDWETTTATTGQASIRALLDDSAVLACLAYVDLNPVRAAIAETSEDSDYTSIQRRIPTLQGASESSAEGENAEPGIAPAPT